jgi:hypothetical protein
MKNTLLKLPKSGEIPELNEGATIVGKIVDITEDYRVKIDYPGNPFGPIIARTTIQTKEFESILYAPVLLIFENDNPALPIIVGIVHENIHIPNYSEAIDVPDKIRHKIVIDGKRLLIEADREIVLRCGKSSLTLQADGKVVVKGKNLVSRATIANKIKGSSVSIN